MSTIANLEKIGDKEAELRRNEEEAFRMRLMGPMGLMGLMALDNTAEEGKLLNEIKTNTGIGIKRLHNLEGMKMRIIGRRLWQLRENL